MKQDYNKIKTAIRYWMHGRDYHLALKAMEFGLKHHTGFRKDGITPEFQHQVSQANFARTLNLMYPNETLATIFLHDVVEDYAVSIHEIEQKFGIQVSKAVELMTNAYPDGTPKPIEIYYANMSNDAIASIAKGCDRMHNHQSMPGVYAIEKMLRKINETNEYILPMLKTARKTFTEQEPAYMNIRHILQIQSEMVEAISDVLKRS